nr:BAF_HP1_G0046970.mRNA.1.CDS.1 [Saccharomyces cerevisiae]
MNVGLDRIDAQKFFSIVLCPMIIGYGLTETVANACVLEPDHFEYGIVGDLVGSVTAKLVDVKDPRLLCKNNQGELLLKGAPVCSEYYKNPIETAVSFTYDGWLVLLESVYRSNSYVKNICVYADESRLNRWVLWYPTQDPYLNLLSNSYYEKGEDIENYIHDKALRNAVFKEIIATAKSQGLVGIELLCGIVFFDEEWTPENGFVTSAQKLKREKS